MRIDVILTVMLMVFSKFYVDPTNQLYNFAVPGVSAAVPFTHQDWLQAELILHPNESEYDANLKFHLLQYNHVLVKVPH